MSGAFPRLRQHHEQWTILAPVAGLSLTGAVNFEFQVDRLILVSGERLPYRRKRLGIGTRLSEFSHRGNTPVKDFFRDHHTFATLRRTGKPIEVEPEFIRIARNELSILALSQLGFRKRRNNGYLALTQSVPAESIDYLLLSPDASIWMKASKFLTKDVELVLDDSWKKFHSKFFFFDLLKILRGTTKVTRAWREDLRRAAVLAGQSQCSSDLPQAFLWNMIVLELLLTCRDDRYSEALPARAKSLLGWVTAWKLNQFEERIGSVYSKRCELVHRGVREAISVEDLLFTDDLVFNLFSNIVRHPEVFPSKAALIQFSRKVDAEHLLGLKTTIRPKTLHFLARKYTDSDLARI